MKRTMQETFLAARKVGTPLIAIRTQDQAGVVNGLQKYSEDPENNKSFMDREGKKVLPVALLTWDIVRGVQALNKAGDAAKKLCPVMNDPMTSGNIVSVLDEARQKLPENTVLFCYNVQRFLDRDGVAQAIWNLREEFKESLRTLVMIGPDFTFPAELGPDVLTLDDMLPDTAALEQIVIAQHAAASLDKPKPKVIEAAVRALAGLARFPAEQVTAMSLTKEGLDLDQLWDRKRGQVQETPGLSIYAGSETFNDIGGCDNVKQFMLNLMNGNDRPGAINFIDEVEKGMAGTAGDTSGVSQEQHGTLLTDMQNNNAIGCLFVGPPGAAKSMVAKALGNMGGIPTIQFDLSAMKASLVGESGARLRQALKVVNAVGQNKVLYIATCNSLGNLSPELRRRFSFGTFFFDLPTEEERAIIWNKYFEKKNYSTIKDKTIPPDTDWTGAEIRNCCDIAWRLNVSLVDAAKYIVPVAKSAAESIKRLRLEADGKFISAAMPGFYQFNEGGSGGEATPKAPTGRRRMAGNLS